MTLIISTALLEEIRTFARISAPHECCGLLVGNFEPVSKCARVTQVRPAANIAAQPRHRFEIDPAVLIAAHRSARAGGPAIIGHYHSHPSGTALPSSVDAAMAQRNGELWLIVGGDGAITGWRAVMPGTSGTLHDCFEPVELTGSPQGALAPAPSGRHEGPHTAC